MQVVIDIGNTRIKWALLDGGKLVAPGNAVHRGDVAAALASLDAALPPRLSRVVVANVAGESLVKGLKTLVARRPGAALELVATTAERFGVRCAYADPSRLGVDRWVAVIAAYRAANGAACVINAGTAVTFDAVDAGGRHLGGLILPGASLIAAALDRNTSDIGVTLPAGDAPLGLDVLGANTDVAVGHGAMLALAAATDRATRIVTQALRAPPTVYLTGGDSQALRSWLETDVDLRADLVLEGLALFAAAQQRN